MTIKIGDLAGGWGSSVELNLMLNSGDGNRHNNSNAAIVILRSMIGNCNLILIQLRVLTDLALRGVLRTGGVGVIRHSDSQQ